MAKPLVIYHANCTDGYGAAFAAWLKLGDEAEYHACQYGSDQHKSLDGFLSYYEVKDREVYVLDFSFPRKVMDSLFANANRVVWLDHHTSVFKDWGFEPYRVYDEEDAEVGIHHHVRLDNDQSGAMLAWRFFHPGTEVPMLIQHIDDRDRWQWELEGSAEIHAALNSRPFNFDAWKRIYFEPGYEQNALEYSYREGRAILRAQKQHVERMVKQARKCLIALDHDIKLYPHELNLHPEEPVTLPGLAVNASIHQSEVGHELANISGTYGLVYYFDADNRVRCSLRSNGEYDVSAIARAFGGGGHRNAAGFETDIETLIGWLK